MEQGIVTTYTYNAQTRRLHNLTAGRSGGTQFQSTAGDERSKGTADY